MDRQQLAAEHPALVESILAEGRVAGATAERDRILAIEGAAIPGHDALVATLKADSTVSAGDAALQILAAERQVNTKMAAAHQAEAPVPVPQNAAATHAPTAAEREALNGHVDASLSVEERAKAAWDKDATLRAEFSSLGSFTAYLRASESGQTRVFKRKSD